LKERIEQYGRRQLAALGRYVYDNYGIAGYAVDTTANYSAPLLIQPASDDAAANKIYDEYFTDWCERADFSGRWDFDMLQRLLSKHIDTDGDIGADMPDYAGFPQIRFHETHFIGDPMLRTSRDGVVMDANKRLLGYDVFIDNKFQFVDSSKMKLFFEPDRISSVRGTSPIRRGLNDLRDAQDIKGFEKLAVKIGSSLPAVISGGVVEEEVWGGSEAVGIDGDQPDNGMPAIDDDTATQMEKKLSLMELLGGDIPVLEDGQEFKPVANLRPGDRIPDFLDLLAAGFVLGLSLPPAFILDAKMTGPNTRAINGKAQRKFNNRQLVEAKFCGWAYVRVIANGIMRDGLPAVPRWYKSEWQGPPKITIDEGRDAAQEREDLANGLMTRQTHYGNRQLGWKREIDQNLNEDEYIIDRCIELAKKKKVSPDMLLGRYFPAKNAAPANTQATNGQDNNSNPDQPADNNANPDQTPDQPKDNQKKK
jgi:hypothetical protein